MTDRETGRVKQEEGVRLQSQAVSTLQICSNPLIDLHGKTPVGNPDYQNVPLPLQGSLTRPREVPQPGAPGGQATLGSHRLPCITQQNCLGNTEKSFVVKRPGLQLQLPAFSVCRKDILSNEHYMGLGTVEHT